MFSNLFDSHTHSDNSPDGKHVVTLMCENAVKNSLMGLAVTDHCEIPDYYSGYYKIRMLQSIFEIKKARAFFRDRLIVTTGMELASPHVNEECTKYALSLAPFDFVIGALHQLEGEEDFYYLDYRQRDADELMRRYYEETFSMIRYGGFDVLAHFNYPLRYIPEDIKKDMDLKKYDGMIAEMFRLLKQKGMGLEVNTSGLRKKVSGHTFPDERLLKMYFEAGGEIVTIGSDAHNSMDIGYGISDVMEMMLKIGFKNFTFYKQRKPITLKII